MADTHTVVINPTQQAAQQLAEDMKRLKASPMDRSIPGGYFIGTDGEPHDAHGNKIEKRSDKAIKAEVAESVKQEQAETPAPAVEAEKKPRSRAKKSASK